MHPLISTLLLTAALLFPLIAEGALFDYTFRNKPLPEALSIIGRDHPELSLTFIYNELENYRCTARISTDSPDEALRMTIGNNPVTLYRHGSDFIIEALQHGRYKYSGRIAGPDHLPVEAATVLLLSPKDSTVVTYAITGADGSFIIPCDRTGVVAKISYLGYKTKLFTCHDFNLGEIMLEEQPVNLKALNVSPDKATIFTDRTIFIPTTRQKNASQTALDLLARMAIPYLRSGGSNGLSTTSGAEVVIFVDFLPADEGDLSGMRMSDVRKVEYYDYPADPRFLGKPHVVNFIMAKYEYGGYLKGYTDHNILYNSGQLNGYGKLQYKRMTYDFRFGGYHRDDDHAGTMSEETFRLPDADARITTFKRYSGVDKSDVKERLYWTTLRATYADEKLTVRNSIAGDFDHWPLNYQSGSVSYAPNIAPTSHYSSNTSSRVNSLSYTGNISVFLPKSNTLTLNPLYSYSHTSQTSDYITGDVSTASSPEPSLSSGGDFNNLAKDHTHKGALSVGFNHTFRNHSNLRASIYGDITDDRIVYTGTADATDLTRSYRLNPSISYSISLRNLYLYASTGLLWQHFNYAGDTDRSTAPSAGAGIQYTFLKKHSLRADLNYNSILPPTHFRSDNIIRSNPLMSYTGNPSLKAEKRYSVSGSYTFFPSDIFSGSIYASADAIDNRALFDYIPYDGGILRTVIQNGGNFSHSVYGAYASVALFNNSLQLSGSAEYGVTRNGHPYGWTKHAFNYSFDAYWYVKAFNFSATFISASRSCPDPMTGLWSYSRPTYFVTAGWADKSWNLRMVLNGFATFSWKNSTSRLTSQWYDVSNEVYGSGHFFIKLAATYTFGFGKKVNQGDESGRVSGVESGILR